MIIGESKDLGYDKLTMTIIMMMINLRWTSFISVITEDCIVFAVSVNTKQN